MREEFLVSYDCTFVVTIIWIRGGLV